jgi:hypothetical protein
MGKKASPPFPKGKTRRRDNLKFTPLNTKISKVFLEIRGDPAFKWPTNMKGDPRRHDPLGSMNTMAKMGILQRNV